MAKGKDPGKMNVGPANRSLTSKVQHKHNGALFFSLKNGTCFSLELTRVAQPTSRYVIRLRNGFD